MKLIREFIATHPWNSLFLMVMLLLAGLVDGLGLSAMLPMLNLVFDSGQNEPDNLTLMISGVLERFGLTLDLGLLLVFIVVAIMLKSLLIFLAEMRIGYLAADKATGLRVELLNAVTASSWSFYVNQSVGKLANSMATEAWRASTAYVFGVRLAVVFIESLVYFIVALLVSWQATLVCLVAGLAVWGLSHQFVKISKYAGSGQTLSYQSLLGLLTDLLQSIKTFKSMGRERSAEALITRETLELKGELRREVLGNAGLDAAQEPLYTLVIVVGIYLALSQFAVELATVTFLTLVLARLLKRGSKVQKQYQRMATSESAYWSLQETLAEARRHVEATTGVRQPVFEREIVLNDVCFGYQQHPVLQDVSLAIPYGQLTCLIGESGTGKSTVADLIIGLMQPDAGLVLVDGVNLKELDLTAWRQNIGYVPQENLLLNDSVYFNLTLGDEALDMDRVTRALKSAGALEFVNAMPDGVYTVVGERGTRLSGGQRQRIMIARALIYNPNLLILDEATSALDQASEAAICETLRSLKGQITILAITHQSALQRIADHVYRIHDAQIELQKNSPE